MADYLKWDNYNYAGNLFNLRRSAHYTIPKPKFLYYVEFNISPSGSRLLSNEGNRRLSFMVKSVDRPNIQYQNQELNQYNRKRTITTGVSYGAMNVTFHDTIDEVALKMIKDYSAFYYHDFNQGLNAWNYDTVPSTNRTSSAGYKPKNSGSDLYFFESISVYEFYNGYYTKYSLANPRFENVNFAGLDMQASEGSEVSISIKPEGIVYEQISAPITADISELFGLPYREGSTNNFIPNEKNSEVGNGIDNLNGYNIAPIDIGGMGSFIGQQVGNIATNFAGQFIGNVIQPTVGNFLNNAGLGILTPAANTLINTGTRAIGNLISSIF